MPFPSTVAIMNLLGRKISVVHTSYNVSDYLHIHYRFDNAIDNGTSFSLLVSLLHFYSKPFYFK